MPSRPNDFGPAARDAESENCLAALVQDELQRANPVLIGVRLPSDKRLLAKTHSMAERKRHGAAIGGRARAGFFPPADNALRSNPRNSGIVLAESQMNEAQPVIDDTLVRRLIANQFPQWAELSVRPMTPGGWDNRTFHLGQHMLVRMPSAADYELQVEKEHRWLPRLARSLPLPIPSPLAMGRPGDGYPWKWSVYGWIDGDTALATPTGIAELRSFATSLAQFLIALQCIDPTGGPSPGLHNFYRGGALTTYDAETREAVAALKGRVDVDAATQVWEAALATSWQGPPVWVHGDVHAGNLLLKGGRLSAVLDFGQLGVGDPACDLSIAWTLFEGDSREAFRTALPLDAGTWARGRAWTLWKAMIVAAGLTGANAVEAARSWHVIEEVLADHRPHRPGGSTT